MKSKLNCVLLIDDDLPTNFLSNLVLEEADCTDHIQIEQSGQRALDYLSKTAANNNGQAEPGYPELIFLDVNMPAMNGWEFLEKFSQLKKGLHKETVIIMLTTSINPDDKIKAEKTPLISGFENKPLTTEIIDKVMNKYFSDKSKLGNRGFTTPLTKTDFIFCKHPKPPRCLHVFNQCIIEPVQLWNEPKC